MDTIDTVLLIQRLSIFVETFNNKPHSELYYSEKLITLKQKQNYERAIQDLRKIHGIFGNNKRQTKIEDIGDNLSLFDAQ